MTNRTHIHQRGSVMITTLIFMLVMTIIALTNIETVGLEEKMAGNLRDANLAFQAAEAGLRKGEAHLQQLDKATDFDDKNGLYDSDEDLWYEVDWNSSTAVISVDDLQMPEISAPPRFYIEEMIDMEPSPEIGEINQDLYFYRVTARGQGGSPNAEAIVQSVYKR